MENRDIENAPTLVVKLIFPNQIELLSILVGKREHISDTKRKKNKRMILACYLLTLRLQHSWSGMSFRRGHTYYLINKHINKQNVMYIDLTKLQTKCQYHPIKIRKNG